MTKHKLYSLISATTVHELMLNSSSGVLLDVRTPAEFAHAHIAGSQNIPLAVLPGELSQIDQSKQVILICRTDRRAKLAADLLSTAGFDAAVLEYGLVGWEHSSLDLVRAGERLSIERQAQLTIGLGVLSGLALAVFVHPWFLSLSAAWGAGLTFAALTGSCPLAMALSKAPWNRTKGPDGISSCCS